MRHLFFYCALLMSTFVFTQNTIIDEKINEHNSSLSFSTDYDKDLLFINKGKVYGSIRGVNEVDAFTFGTIDKTNIINDQKFSSYSKMEFDDSYLGMEFSTVGWLTNYKVFNSGKLIATIDKNELKDLNNISFYSKDFFYGLANEKGKEVENLAKNDLFLKIFSVSDKKIKSVKLTNNYLLNEDNKDYKNEKKVYFISNFHKDNFEIVTKFLSEDFKSCLIRRTLYDYQGKFIKIIDLKVAIDFNMIFSNNGGALIESGQIEMFIGNGAVNNFFVDNDNNIFVYGLYTKKGSNPYMNKISGYYVIKYDNNGNLIWKCIHNIDDKDVNENGAKTRTHLMLGKSDKGILSLKIFKRYNDQYLYNSQIDASNGQFISESTTLFNVDSMGLSEYFNAPLRSTLQLKDLKNIRFGDYSFGFLIYQTNPKVKAYVDNLNNSKNKTYLEFLQSKSGIWLVESDNKSFYKVTCFKND